MYEKRLAAVPPQLFTSNGAANGKVLVNAASLFKVKQLVVITSSSQPNLNVQVKRIDDINTIYVGDPNQAITDRTDVSAYTVADGAFIYATEQNRPSVPEEQVERITYEEEPTVARRVVIVDKLGNKIDSVTDLEGKNRLSVDAAVTLESVTTNLDAISKIPPDNVLSVGSEDGTKTGVKHVIKVGSDGKLEVKDIAIETSIASVDSKLNTLGQKTKVGSVPVVLASDQDPLPIDLDAFTATPDNALAVGTEDGTKTGVKHVIKIGLDGKLEVKDTAAEASLASIDSKLNTLGQKAKTGSISVVLASDQDPIQVDLDAFSATPDNVMIVGTEDGTKTGVKRGFVNNIRSQILATQNRTQDITYADFGTKDQRVTQIDYQSATFPGVTARKTFSYSLVGTRYRRDSIDWTIV